jgi:hypothetical protein
MPFALVFFAAFFLFVAVAVEAAEECLRDVGRRELVLFHVYLD